MPFWKEWRETLPMFLLSVISIIVVSHIRCDEYRLEFFEIQFWVVTVLCLAFAAPFLGAGAVAGEREAGTFDVLAAKPVRLSTILLIKYSVRLGGILLALGLLTAIFYLIRPTHNINMYDVARGLVIFFAFLCFSFTVSFCISCFTDTSSKALTGGLVLFFMALLVINATPFFKYAWWWHNSLEEMWLGYFIFYGILSILVLIIAGVGIGKQIKLEYGRRHLAIAGIVLFLVFIRSVSSTFWLIPQIAISGDMDFIQLCREPVSSILDYTSRRSKSSTVLLRRYLVNANGPRIDEELMHELKNPEARIRNEALRILIERKTEKARKVVIPLLNDPDDEVVHSALAFALALKCKEAIPELINLLDHPNSSIRTRAVFALTPIAGKTAGPNLMKALKDRNPRVKTAAALGLCQMDFAEAQDEVVKIMQEDPIKHTRRAVAMYLRYMKSAPACEALVQTLSDEDEGLVGHAIYSLRELECEDAVMPLLESLKANPGRAPHIFPVLARIGNAEAETALKELFHNAAAGSRNKTNTAVALAEMGDPTGIPYLREGPIGDTNTAVRLARAGEYSAVPALLPMLQKGYPANRYFYGKVLEELTGKKYGWDSKKWKKWWEKNKEELLQTTLAGNVRKGGS